MLLAQLTFHKQILVILNKKLGDGNAHMNCIVTFRVHATICMHCTPVQAVRKTDRNSAIRDSLAVCFLFQHYSHLAVVSSPTPSSEKEVQSMLSPQLLLERQLTGTQSTEQLDGWVEDGYCQRE